MRSTLIIFNSKLLGWPMIDITMQYHFIKQISSPSVLNIITKKISQVKPRKTSE